jgi:hypothetical protein
MFIECVLCEDNDQKECSNICNKGFSYYDYVNVTCRLKSCLQLTVHYFHNHHYMMEQVVSYLKHIIYIIIILSATAVSNVNHWLR